MSPKLGLAFLEPALLDPTGLAYEAYDVEALTETLGVNLNEITNGLLIDGLRRFTQSYDDLLAALIVRRDGPRPTHAPQPAASRHDGPSSAVAPLSGNRAALP